MTSSAPVTLDCKTGLTTLLVIGSIRLLGSGYTYPRELPHPNGEQHPGKGSYCCKDDNDLNHESPLAPAPKEACSSAEYKGRNAIGVGSVVKRTACKEWKRHTLAKTLLKVSP